MTPLVWLIVGVLTLVGLVYGLSALDARQKGLDPAVVASVGNSFRMSATAADKYGDE